MSVQYVYTIQQLKKIWPGGKEVLKDINLSFLPGAKIGVLGINGSGKSTLLKIIAGIDKEFNGEAWAAEGLKIGYLSQEPRLDEKLSVLDLTKYQKKNMHGWIDAHVTIHNIYHRAVDQDRNQTQL